MYGPPAEVPIFRNTLDESLEHPLGSVSLGALVERRKAKKVLVIVDDIARPTPQKEMLARLLPVFEEHAIPRRNLTILVALGLYRAMTRGEFEQRYGSEVASDYTIVNHPRCAHAVERCRIEPPPLRECEPGRLVACHRAEELPLKGIGA